MPVRGGQHNNNNNKALIDRKTHKSSKRRKREIEGGRARQTVVVRPSSEAWPGHVARAVR